MEIEHQILGEVHVLAVSGRLDTATSPQLEHSCLDLLEAGAVRIVFDLGDLAFMSSAGLRVLLVTLKRLTPLGGRVAVVRPYGVVRESLLIAGFDRLMPILDDLGEAIGAM